MESEDKQSPQEAVTVIPYAAILMLSELIYELKQRDRDLAVSLAERYRKLLESPMAKSFPDSMRLIKTMAEFLEIGTTDGGGKDDRTGP